MQYQFTWEPTPPVSTGAEARRVAVFALGVGSVFVCSVLAQLAVSFLFSLLAPALLGQMWFRLLASTLCLYLCGMLPGWLILRRIPAEPIDRHHLGAPALLATISVSVVFLLVGSLAGNLVNAWLSFLTGEAIQNPVEELTGQTPLGVMALCTVVLAPVAEELFFRKAVMDRLRRYGDAPAILISAVIFGLAHGNFSQFFYAFLLGLVFGALYCRTGSVRYGIALHMAINFFGSAYSTLLLRRIGDATNVEALLADPIALGMYLGDLAVYGLAILAFIPSMIYLLRRLRLRRWHNPYSFGQWGRIVLCNPAVWLMVAVFVFQFLL